MRNDQLKVKSEKLKVNGFGLIETLIACGIVAMIGAASAGLSNSIIKNNRLGYQKIIATNLASEAIEIAHWIRDKNTSDGLDTTDWLSSGSAVDLKNCSECGITPISRDALGASVQEFKYDADPDNITINGVGYIRKIKTSYSNNELNITVSVTGNGVLLSEISSVLTNWK